MKTMQLVSVVGLGMLLGMAAQVGDLRAEGAMSPVDPVDPITGKWVKNSYPGPVKVGELGTNSFFYGNDDDMDGIPNSKDKCPNTPKGATVDMKGCPLDSDGDGVPDYLDSCPSTLPGMKVDPKGCPVDSDGDNYYDVIDSCPNSPKLAPVDDKGCWVVKPVHFDTGKAKIRKEDVSNLKTMSEILNHNPDVSVGVLGHTDSVGSDRSNKALSNRRTQAVKKFLTDRDVERGQLKATGFGESKPIAPNETKEGRAQNRRVEFEPSVR